jgi:hypothetical protein
MHKVTPRRVQNPSRIGRVVDGDDRPTNVTRRNVFAHAPRGRVVQTNVSILTCRHEQVALRAELAAEHLVRVLIDHSRRRRQEPLRQSTAKVGRRRRHCTELLLKFESVISRKQLKNALPATLSVDSAPFGQPSSRIEFEFHVRIRVSTERFKKSNADLDCVAQETQMPPTHCKVTC